MASPLEEAAASALEAHQGRAPNKLDPKTFFDERLQGIKWLPVYLFQVGEEYWAIEIVRNDMLSDETAREMRAAHEAMPTLLSAVVIPEGEGFTEARELARKFELRAITPGERGYAVEVLVPTTAPVPSHKRAARIPEGVRAGVASLTNLPSNVSGILSRFTERHRSLEEKGIDDESEASVLRESFEELISCDPRFAGSIGPLLSLRRFEQVWEASGVRFRDHFFHSFQDFLLGCLVIDAFRPTFESFLHDAFPSTSDMSPEYIWLLVALYHDVGYLTQRGDEVLAARFGAGATINPLTGEREAALAEQEVALKDRLWQNHALNRRAITSLYDHLTQSNLIGEWLPDTLSQPAHHSLDEAFRRSFLSQQSHGAASAFRLLADISEYLGKAGTADKPFLQRHVYLAALSIPFHDWHVRRELVAEGMMQLTTSRFPFASLLTFIDSIQDDRRDPKEPPVAERDALEGLSIDGDYVVAHIDTSRLSPEFRQEKQKEIRGVLSFLDQDGLKFRYPGELA